LDRREHIMTHDIAQDITERVRERYAAAAQQAVSGDRACCSRSCCSADEDVVTGNLYDTADTAGLPEEAVLASLGCGNPTALIGLQEGQTVLDLGSGGGIDVLLSAKRVGPSGFVYGLDMTDEMLALAMSNKEKAGATNVAFLKGHIENIPLPAHSVDVVISNCVINLAADKSLVLKEAFRVLKPGGHFAVSDVVAEGAVPADFRQNMEAWVGCLAGALKVDEYRALLAGAGFEDITIDITRRYTVAEAGLDTSGLAPGWETADGKLASAFVRAAKPAHPVTRVPADRTLQTASAQSGPCCDSTCCS
jgi:arsenite methyltransferase